MVKINELELQKTNWKPLANHCVDETGVITRWYLSPKKESVNIIVAKIDRGSLKDNLLFKSTYGGE